MSKPPARAVFYRPDIDGLRAFAVLIVIAFHAFPWGLQGGFVGVDVFFVISGYLISGHIFDGLESGRFSFGNFYAKRVRRIFPALIAVLLACLAFGWLALLTDEYQQLGSHVAAGAGFVSNLVLWQESGYFDNSTATKPLLHLWSLGVEEQFYIVWPMAAWALWRLRWNPVVVILTLATASFAYNAVMFRADPVLDFYSPLTRFWELLAGALLAQIERSKTGEPVPPVIAHLASLSGISLLVGSLLFIREGDYFPGWWALMPVAGAVLLIAAGPQGVANRLMSWKPWVFIGLISYPLYLWHWPLLSFARIVEGATPPRDFRMWLVAATFALAIGTYFLIERPLRFGAARRVTVAALSTGMALTGMGGLWVWWNGGLPERPSIVAMTEANSQFSQAIWKHTNNPLCLERYPFPAAEGYHYWFCMANKDTAPEILLLGNSYANHLYPGIAAQPRLAEYSILSIGTCPPMAVPEVNNEPPGPCEGENWRRQQDFIQQVIADSGSSLKLAVLSGIDPVATPSVIARVRAWVDFLDAKGVQVIIFHPHLRFPNGDLKGCFARPLRAPLQSCEIDPGAFAAAEADFAPLVEEITRTNPDTLFFDQNQVFCTEDNCSFVAGGKPLFRDEYGHYSEFGSALVARLFADWMNEAGVAL